MMDFILNSFCVLAQLESETATVSRGTLPYLIQQLISATVFSILGIAVLGLGYWIIEKVSPIPILKEIEEDQNVALAIIMGAVVIGMSIIIAAAVHG